VPYESVLCSSTDSSIITIVNISLTCSVVIGPPPSLWHFSDF